MISEVSSTDSVVCVMYARRDIGRERQRLGLGDVLHEHRCVRRLAHRPDHFLVALVADQDHGVPVCRVPPRLDVHLGHEGARRVDHVVVQLRGVRMHGGGDAVCRVDHRCPRRNLRLLLHEDRAPRLEIADDVDVVDDLLADVDRGAVMLQRLLDRVHRAFDAGAVAARRCEKDAFDHADRVSVPGDPANASPAVASKRYTGDA